MADAAAGRVRHDDNYDVTPPISQHYARSTSPIIAPDAADALTNTAYACAADCRADVVCVL